MGSAAVKEEETDKNEKEGEEFFEGEEDQPEEEKEEQKKGTYQDTSACLCVCASSCLFALSVIDSFEFKLQIK